MSSSDFLPVAVIVPCFRCAATIDRAVSSVVKQSLQPKEIFLVDDASGDQTWEKLCQLQEMYPEQVRLIRLESNSGAAVARNKGVRAATQPYIAFLDADDAWHPKKLEIQHAFMQKNADVALSGHAHKQLDSESELPDWAVDGYIAKSVSKSALAMSNRFVTPSVMLRRDTNLFFIDKQRHMEDHMLWMSIIFRGGRVVMLSAELAAIYKKPFGVSGLSSQMWLMERSELGNYHRLYREDFINVVQFGLLAIYSLVKFVRRLILSRWPAVLKRG